MFKGLSNLRDWCSRIDVSEYGKGFSCDDSQPMEMQMLEPRLLLSVTMSSEYSATVGLEGYSTHVVTLTSDAGNITTLGLEFNASEMSQQHPGDLDSVFDMGGLYAAVGMDEAHDSHVLIDEQADKLVVPGAVDSSTQLKVDFTGFTGFASQAIVQIVVPDGVSIGYEIGAVVNGEQTNLAGTIDGSPLSPVLDSAIDDMEVHVFAEQEIDLSGYFSDADSLTLDYTVTGNSVGGLASTAIVGSVLTITGLDAVGATTITVEAEDGDGLTAADSFVVTMVNDGPVVVSVIADVSGHVFDDDVTINLAGVFEDTEEGDAVTYSVVNDNGAVVSAGEVGGVLTLTFADDAEGSAQVTVRATDSQGEFIEDVFDVVVVNDGPAVVWAIGDVQANVNDDDVEIGLAGVFEDTEEGDDVTYAVSSDNEAVVTVSEAGGVLTLTFVEDQVGSATITVRATDSLGEFVEDVFDVVVVNDAPVVVDGIDDFNVVVSGDDSLIELAGVFEDTEDGDDLTYEVVSNSNDTLVTTSIAGGVLTLDYALNERGSAVITIRATDSLGLFVDDTFTVVAGFEVEIGEDSTDGKKSVVFADGDGSIVTVTYNGAGVATVRFVGTNLTQEVGSRSMEVGGTGVTMTEVLVAGSTISSSLDIKVSGGGDGLTTVGDIVVDNGLKAIKADKVDLLGDITVGGSLLSLTMHDIDAAHTIDIGDSGGEKDVLTFKANRVVDTALVSDIPIKSLTAAEWVDEDDVDNDSISTSLLTKLTVSGNTRELIAGDFEADLDGVDGGEMVLGGASIKGTVGDGTWSVDGLMGSVSAGAFSNWTANFDEAKSIASKGDFTGALDGGSVKSLSVKGNFDADMTLAGSDGVVLALGSAKIGGTLSGSSWIITGDVGSIAAEVIDGWSVDFEDAKSITSKGDLGMVGAGMVGDTVKSLSAKGDWTGSLMLTNMGDGLALGSAKVTGVIAGSSWIVVGDVGSISAGAFDTWDATLGGDVKSVKSSGDFVGDITGDSIKSLSAGGDYTGDVTLGGGGEGVRDTLGSVKVKGTLSDGGDGWVVNGSVGSVSAGAIDSWDAEFGDVKSIKSSGGFSGSIEANTLGGLSAGEDFDGDLELAGVGELSYTLKSAKVKGDVLGGTWTIDDGLVGSIAANSFAGWTGVFGDDGGVVNVKSIKSTAGFDGTVSANSIGSLSVGGDYSGDLTLAGAGELRSTLKSAKVKGAVNGGDWTVELGAVGSISGGSFVGWDGIFGSFANSVNVKSIKVSADFSGDIVANSLGSLSVRGDMAGDVILYGQGELRQSLKSVKVTGALSDDDGWVTLGDIGSIAAGSFVGWDAEFAGGNVKSIKSGADFSGSVLAESVKSMSVRGNLVNTSLALTRDAAEARLLGLGSLKVTGEIRGGNWDIEGHVGAVSAGAIVDGVGVWTVDVEGDIKSVKSNAGMSGIVDANSLSSLSTRGDYSGELTLAGVDVARTTLGSAKIGGAMMAGDWEVVGESGALSFGSITAMDGVFGVVKSVVVKGNATADIEVVSVKTFSVKGNYVGGELLLSQGPDDRIKAVSTFTVGGVMDDSMVRSAGNIGNVTVGSMVGGSLIYAGVDDGVDGLPLVADDSLFDKDVSIGRVTLKGLRGVEADAFADSFIAAWTIGRVSMKAVGLTDGGDGFGLTANSISSLSAVIGEDKLSLRGLDDAGVAAGLIDATGLDLDNFEIRLF